MTGPAPRGPSPAGGLEGLSALVTGGAGGIGLATAERLAADGAQVTVCGRTEATLLEAAARIAEVAGPGGGAHHLVADVTVEDDVAAAVAAAARPTGRLDILFACAGGAHHMGPLVDCRRGGGAGHRRAQPDRLVPVRQTRRGGHGRRRAGGSIVLMSSGTGHFPHRWLGAYGMSKAGIESLCAYAAEELGASSIRVNAVQPGIIDDELMSFITAGGPLLDDYLAQMPLSRVGTVSDVAAAVRFLAGPESSWITGECLAVDGGHHLRRGADYSLLGG